MFDQNHGTTRHCTWQSIMLKFSILLQCRAGMYWGNYWVTAGFDWSLSSGLSVGSIVGVSLGSFFGLLFLVGILFCIRSKKWKKKLSKRQSESQTVTVEPFMVQQNSPTTAGSWGVPSRDGATYSDLMTIGSNVRLQFLQVHHTPQNNNHRLSLQKADMQTSHLFRRKKGDSLMNWLGIVKLN